MKCDKLKAEPMIINDDYMALYYPKESVDAAIAELKAENERLVKCCKEYDSRRRIDERIRFNGAQQLRATKRALWLARAERAKEMCQRLLIQGFDPKWEEKSMCKYCRFGVRGKFKGRTPDFIILQDRFALKIEKDEPYVGDYGLTVSDNEDECEFSVAINFCPMCGRKLSEDK